MILSMVNTTTICQLNTETTCLVCAPGTREENEGGAGGHGEETEGGGREEQEEGH